jgi:hypothetical protein
MPQSAPELSATRTNLSFERPLADREEVDSRALAAVLASREAEEVAKTSGVDIDPAGLELAVLDPPDIAIARRLCTNRYSGRCRCAAPTSLPRGRCLRDPFRGYTLRTLVRRHRC